MIQIVLLILLSQTVVCLEPNSKCMEIAKPTICANFFPTEMKNCLAHNVITYNKITLNLCSSMKSHQGEQICMELRQICSEYRFAAVYAPTWPPNEEYFFDCSSEKLVNLGVGTGGAVCFLVACFSVAAFCRLKRQQLETFVDEPPLNVNVNISSPRDFHFQQQSAPPSTSETTSGSAAAAASAPKEQKLFSPSATSTSAVFEADDKSENEEGRDYFISEEERQKRLEATSNLSLPKRLILKIGKGRKVASSAEERQSLFVEKKEQGKNQEKEEEEDEAKNQDQKKDEGAEKITSTANKTLDGLEIASLPEATPVTIANTGTKFLKFMENLAAKKGSKVKVAFIDSDEAKEAKEEAEARAETGAEAGAGTRAETTVCIVEKEKKKPTASMAGFDNPNYDEVDLHDSRFVDVPKIPGGMTEAEYWMEDEKQFLSSNSTISSNSNYFDLENNKAKSLMSALEKK